MKQLLITVIALTATFISATSAADRQRFYDFAKVKDVTPIYKTFEHRIPEEQCWTETVRVEQAPHRRDSATGTIVGGIIGGALGHAVGHGKKNKKLGAAVGTVLGASIGNDISRQEQHSRRGSSHAYYEDVERCEVQYSTQTEERLVGYDVTYKYRGETFVTKTKEHPGQRLKISVSIRPAH